MERLESFKISLKYVDIINYKYAIILNNLHNKDAENYIETKQYNK
jgi:hypothetical protein